MCEYCRKYRCVSSCPSYEKASAEPEEGIWVCSACGLELYCDDAVYTRGEEVLCEECALTDENGGAALHRFNKNTENRNRFIFIPLW